jgi:kynurenine formamidase
MRRLSYIECTTQGIIPVEGLVLDDVPPGLHQLHCLPLKLIGADGAPVRCIIISS